MRRWGLAALPAAALAAAVALAGCGGKQSAEPKLAVTASQEDGALVVRISTENWQPGKDGHVHIYLNDGPEAMIYGYTYRVPGIEPGRYKIHVELANPRHEHIGVSETIYFDVQP
ncbi:hypothetical protein [Symbiobacterium thermophilum]|uniref:Conserved domain protein n=2 Tax=Symbiobacterium thermophilum TaxID=2734 RepID=Q67MS7_SYMTH|nr:hypothetical protein [Symbiobacterium thermophilum]MBY6275588.1 hypothetical protein [Symbiobacterium thermophilum]BAD41016.1 conserved domain protein [Symbiobacterium thermophilum IAM 14863]